MEPILATTFLGCDPIELNLVSITSTLHIKVVVLLLCKTEPQPSVLHGLILG